MKTSNTKKPFEIALALLVLSVVALTPLTSAQALIYEITLTGTATDFLGIPVFDEFGPTYDFSTTFQIDTDAAPIVVLPAGTDGWTTDLYGYDSSALVGGIAAQFGTVTFTEADLLSVIPSVGYVANIWFDEVLSDGGTPNIWTMLSKGGVGDFFLGMGGCGATCQLYANFSAMDWSSGNNADGYDLTVSVQSAVPEPDTGLLILVGLVGLAAHTRSLRSGTDRE